MLNHTRHIRTGQGQHAAKVRECGAVRKRKGSLWRWQLGKAVARFFDPVSLLSNKGIDLRKRHTQRSTHGHAALAVNNQSQRFALAARKLVAHEASAQS